MSTKPAPIGAAPLHPARPRQGTDEACQNARGAAMSITSMHDGPGWRCWAASASSARSVPAKGPCGHRLSAAAAKVEAGAQPARAAPRTWSGLTNSLTHLDTPAPIFRNDFGIPQ
jgi:hypothetical protein